MAKYRIMETTIAKHPVESQRVCGSTSPIFYIQRQFLGIWFYVDYWYTAERCRLHIQELRGEMASQREHAVLRATPDRVVEVIG